MTSLSLPRAVLAILALSVIVLAACGSASNTQAEADLIRAAEHERVGALVAANMDVARQLHADDFQLMWPGPWPG